MTPSQLYVFMPPNLGGFFMVRSYYPSECHADYFDFERIEALKPAIEACGISTLSQRSEERFSRNAETDLVCRLLLEKKKAKCRTIYVPSFHFQFFFFNPTPTTDIYTLSLHDALPISNCMFSCLQILEAFLWFVLITLLNVTLIILTLSVSRLLNLLLRLVAFLLFLNPQCLASISRWITASSSWKRFCLFVCRALSSIMVICMLTAIRLLLTFVMSLYLLLRS